MSRLRRLWSNVSAPLRSADARSPGDHVGGTGHIHGPIPSTQEEHAQFNEQLTSLLARNKSINAGNIQFLGLTKIKEKYAAVWDRIADKVDQATRREIEHHLGPGDIYSRIDDGYVIVFATLSNEEAENRCAMIAQELSSKLLGDEGADQALIVTSMVVEVDSAASEHPVEDINHLKNILAQEHKRHEIGADLPNKTVRPASTPPQRLSSARERPSGGPRKTSREGGAATSRSTTSSGKKPVSRGRGERLDLAATEDRKRRQSEFLASLKEVDDTGLEFMYEPLWNVASDAVGTYRCIPTRVNEEGELLVGDDALKSTKDAPEISLSWRTNMLDWNCLNWVRKDLERNCGDRETNFLAAAPIHFSTLADGAVRAEYIELCRSFSDDMCRFLVFELVGVDPRVYHEALLRAVILLKPYGRAIILNRPIEHSNFKNVETIGLHSVGPDLSLYRGKEESLQKKMEEYVERANQSGFKTYIAGLSSTSMATAAICAGFDFVGGPAIAMLTDRPSGIVDFKLENLFIPKSGVDDLFDSIEFDPPANQADEGAEPMEHDRLNNLVGSEEEIALARRFVETHGLSLEDAMLLAHVKTK